MSTARTDRGASGGPGAFGAMVDAVLGRPSSVGPADDAARRAKALRRAADVLRREKDPALASVASGLERHVTRGGDLNALIGVRPGRGRALLVPDRAEQKRRRDEALRALADELPGTNRAVALRQAIEAGHPRVLAIRAKFGEVPSSPAQCARIVRAPTGQSHPVVKL